MLNFLDTLPFKNIDLLSVAVTIAAIGILGFVVYMNSPKSITNKTFFLFSIVTILWSICNYIDYQPHSLQLTLWISRMVIFLGVWHSFTFFQFFYVFPEAKKKFTRLYRFLLVPYVSLVSLFTLTPFVFSGIAQLSSDGSVSKVIVQKGVILFIVTVIGLIISAIICFLKKGHKARGTERGQYRLILIGTILTFSLLFTFNLLLPILFTDVRFIPLGAVFIFPFIAFTFYAIYKHHLFNIKVAAVAFVAFIMTVFSFFNILYAENGSQVAVNITVFVAILLGSIILIQTILREVQEREKIQDLADELKQANDNQVQLIHFITHQIKGFFTKSRGIFSLLLEGDVGDIPEAAKQFIRKGFDSDTKGVAMVQDFLNASNIKSGTTQFTKEPFDLKVLIAAMVIEYKSMAEEKGLALSFQAEESPVHENHSMSAYTISGDQEQLKQVFKNLIENSIKYTLQGSVAVSLSHKDDRIVFAVKDTGVGISSEDKRLLFTQGGRGKDSIKVNVDSTGYGLYIAKGIVEAHQGRIWAESEGAGKGSQFYVELPTV